jgi:hypothetical protein
MWWRDTLVAAGVLALAALAVERILADHGGGGEPVPVPRIEAGEVLDPDWVLADLEGVPRRIAEGFGSRATVLYSWKVGCPCIDRVEPRIRALTERFGADRGVAWIAVDGEMEDDPEAIARKSERLGARYAMYLDPEQRLLSRLGLDRATLVAVVDGSGRLAYRGSIDDDYENPTRSWLGEALDAVVAGARPDTPETAPVYGCEYSAAPACPVEPAAP